MPIEETSAEILKRYREGDQDASDELFSRYVGRLTLLARSRLSPALARRSDPEDVVLSAYRSFFIRARDGRLTLEHGAICGGCSSPSPCTRFLAGREKNGRSAVPWPPGNPPA